MMEEDRKTGISQKTKGKFSSKKSYTALAILLLVYITHSIDRTIVSIIGQPIKEDLQLTDWQLGLMGGLGFSLFYVTIGFPLARYADRGNRVALLSVCIFVWSAMTALCGLTANFVQLLLARAGVGSGEAGCLPPAHSLIADYFPAGRRSSALAIFGLGLPLGGFIGTLIGGLVVDNWGWRTAFFLIGILGLPLALLVKLVIKEPVRGRFELTALPTATAAATSSFKACLLYHARSVTSRNILIAMTLLMTFTGPFSVFLAPYMVRKFGLSYSDLGFVLATSMMFGGVISTLAGGFLAEWFGRRDARWYLFFPAICSLASGTLYFATFMQETLLGFAVMMFFAASLGATYLAPCYATLHNTSPPEMRATTTAIVQFLMSFIGLGLGPLLAGISIDALSQHYFTNLSAAGSFRLACPGGIAPVTAGPDLAKSCHTALTAATQMTLTFGTTLVIWPALHLLRAGIAIGRSR